MNKKHLHTPDGVRDIYESECEKKLLLEEAIMKVIRLCGYRSIQTPSFEYEAVYRRGSGAAASSDLYKFLDRDGNTLVLRPDFTPAIARVCATALADSPLPLRLSYMGSTFRNHTSFRGELKEVTELGAELIGDDSIEADAEIAALTVKCLLSAGITDFQVSIGENDFFKGIVNEAGLDSETEETLRELIINKNLFGVEKLIGEKEVTPQVRAALEELPGLFGGFDILEKAKALAVNEESRMAVERLRKLHELLALYGCSERITFDFSMLGSMDYYTGVTFKAYTYGTGDAIAKGGRYDKLLSKFGKDTPAIGFVVVVDEIMSALRHQKKLPESPAKRTLLVYGEEMRDEAILLAEKLRDNGQMITLRSAAQMGETAFEDTPFDRILQVTGEETVRMTNVKTGLKKDFPLRSFL